MNTGSSLLSTKCFRISPELFTKGYPDGSGPCTCSSTCCEGGVNADIYERDAILAHAGLVRASMDATQAHDSRFWFETDERNDSDYPSGRSVATREINGKCAFLDGIGRCTLQVAAQANGMDKWALKPLFCILYPLNIEDGVVGFDDMLTGEQECCTAASAFTVPLFRACRDELTHLLGEDGYATLEQYYSETKKDFEEGATS